MKIIPAAVVMAFTIQAASAASLAVDVGNVSDEPGIVRVVVYGEDNFLSHHPAYGHDATPHDGHASVRFENLPKGRWAVLAFHDTNANGELDMNFLGIPVEQFGFSNDPGYSHRPTFSETEIILLNDNRNISIKLSD